MAIIKNNSFSIINTLHTLINPSFNYSFTHSPTSQYRIKTKVNLKGDYIPICFFSIFQNFYFEELNKAALVETYKVYPERILENSPFRSTKSRIKPGSIIEKSFAFLSLTTRGAAVTNYKFLTKEQKLEVKNVLLLCVKKALKKALKYPYLLDGTGGGLRNCSYSEAAYYSLIPERFTDYFISVTRTNFFLSRNFGMLCGCDKTFSNRELLFSLVIEKKDFKKFIIDILSGGMYTSYVKLYYNTDIKKGTPEANKSYKAALHRIIKATFLPLNIQIIPGDGDSLISSIPPQKADFKSLAEMNRYYSEIFTNLIKDQIKEVENPVSLRIEDVVKTVSQKNSVIPELSEVIA